MSGNMQFYLAAVPAVILFGLSKGGFSGLSTLGAPLMSLVASPANRIQLTYDAVRALA